MRWVRTWGFAGAWRVGLGIVRAVALDPAQATPDPGAPGFERLDVAAAVALAAEVDLARYPDADAVLVSGSRRVRYEPDGRAVELSEEVVRYLTEKGRRGGRVRSYGFMAHYGRVEILEAEVIRPDGTVLPVDVAAQSREMVEPSQMGSNIFDPNQRVLRLTFPELEIGDMTRLTVRRTTDKARVPGSWSDYAVFEFTRPILRYVYEVHAPAERPLSSIRLRDPVPETVVYRQDVQPDGGIVHRWTIQDVPQAFAEPNMPSLHTVVQRLLVSTLSDWREISRWYWDLSAPRLAATTEAMQQEVDRLIEDAESHDERIRRLFTFVSQQIRYMGVTPEEEAPGYEPHDVSMTFENRYGVCRDKAALLVAMLRMADIPAYPVLINVGPRMDEEVPLPFFNHAIVAAEREGVGPETPPEERYVLMDPTDEKTRELLPATLRNKSYLVAHPEGETLRTVPPAPASEHRVRIATEGRLDEDRTLTLRTTLVFDGINDNAYRNALIRMRADERRRFFEGLVRSRVAGATLKEFELLPEVLSDTGQPLTAHLGYAVTDYAVEGDRAWLFELPWLGGSVGYVNWVIGRTGLTERRFPLDTDPTCGVEETLSIDLGAARTARPLSVPPALERRSDGLAFEQRVTLGADGRLVAESRFDVLAVEFSADEYLGLREDLQEIEVARRRRLLLEGPASAPEADVRIRSEEHEVEWSEAGAWSTVTRTRKQVLTYAGTKDHAEIKLHYNPVWQEVELLEARVTAPDGRVFEVADHERNVMDAAWVGAAPRYPAERILVVSLPGVEVGSVIETVVRRTHVGAPFFDLRTTLQGHEPRDHYALTLRHPVDRRLAGWSLHLGASVRHTDEVQEDGWRTLRWEARDVPAVVREDDLPPAWGHLPTVLLSDGDWREYAAELHRRMLARASDQPLAQARAEALAAGLDGPYAIAKAVRDEVARSIRVAGPSFVQLPLESLSPADVVLRDGYGHRADVAILIWSMLRSLGVEAEPMLVAGGAPVLASLVDPLWEVPQRSLFNTVLVRVPTERGVVWLNDTDQYAELGVAAHQDAPSLDLTGQRGAVTVDPDRSARHEQRWNLEIGLDGEARIDLEHRHHGAAIGGFRRQFTELTPEARRRHHQELVGSISQSAVPEGPLEVDLEGYPGVLRLPVRAPRYAIRDGETLYLTLPGIDSTLFRMRSESRLAPLYRGRDAVRLSRHVLLFPAETAEVLLAPPSLSFDLPGGFGEVRLSTVERRLPDGRLELTVVRELALESAIAEADLYPALLAMQRRLLHPSFRTVAVALTPGS